MNYSIYKKDSKPQYMEVRNGQGVDRIELGKVLYFTSDVRVIEAHMMKGHVFRFYGKLDEVQEELGKNDWLRCHKSFLVNRKYIRQITREYLITESEQIPVSRNYYQKFREMGLIGKDKDKIQVMASMHRQKPGVVRCISGTYKGMEYHIYPNEKLVFGRGYDQADVVLEEPEISRVHCWIQYNHITDRYYISDQSVNGTYINGQKIEVQDSIIEMKAGDQIQLAKTQQIFEVR